MIRIDTALSDRYRVERELGAGGMATVYLAEDLKHHRKVAIKVLHAELSVVLGSERFLKEIELTAGLQHPHILPLFDSGDAGGLLYYVMPYVEGETLRARLTRETQLAVPDAIRITAEVADALDYAHKRGVIHRDIKPENILLRDGHALLADFGIALAVREAGGNRLTQSGLSLGTPQYMSPEQATGNRQVDARSDVYSLAAVLYEMLAGEPPVSGATAQAMIAKLLTERPPALSVLRESVPVGMSDAVAKALAKTPADRFATAGEFVAAVQAGAASPTSTHHSRRTPVLVGGTATVLVAGAIAAITLVRHAAAHFALGDRVQLTTSGDVLSPAISGDGKQLAYFTRNCGRGGCSYSVVVQEAAGTAKRTLLSDASDGNQLTWSPDRQHLLFDGAIKGVNGQYLLSTLGGEPRFVLPGPFSSVAFFAGGDSLLTTAGFHADSIYFIGVASLDGVLRDSIRFVGPPAGLANVSTIPETPWIIASITLPGPRRVSPWTIIDRHGSVADRHRATCWCELVASHDAVWARHSGPGPNQAIRVPIDPVSGHFGSTSDTLSLSGFGNLSVTADGASLLVSQVASEYSAWALDFDDVLAGRLPEAKRIGRASVPIAVTVSPDGNRLSIERATPRPGGADYRMSTMPFGGGPETPVITQGRLDAYDWTGWVDSVSLGLSTRTSKGHRLVLHDVRTGAERDEVYVPDSLIFGAARVPGGWLWLPWGGGKVLTQVRGNTRAFSVPHWFGMVFGASVDSSHNRVALSGVSAANQDSTGIYVVSLVDGTETWWATLSAPLEALTAHWMDDGSLVVAVPDTRGLWTLYRLRSPGRLEKIGTIPRQISGLWFDRTMRHATFGTEDVHGDAWLLRMVRR